MSKIKLMASRYLRWQFCMEVTYGQGFAPRLGRELVINKWGISAPRLRNLLAQPVDVQKIGFTAE